MKKQILIIDDDLNTCRSLKDGLQDEHVDVHYVFSFEDALSHWGYKDYSLVILDVCCPDEDGISRISQLRDIRAVPILVTIEREKADGDVRARIYSAGAVGILEKPYHPKECRAVVYSMLDLYISCRTKADVLYTLAFGADLIIDPSHWKVVLFGEQIILTRKEFELLYCLADHAGQVISPGRLYTLVWGDDPDIYGEGTVKAHIGTLRKKMNTSGKLLIQNVWGVGYRFVPPQIVLR